MSKKDDLSPRQEAFCREYLIDKNGTKAAIRAGYKERGASQQASVLLGYPKVQRRVRELIDEQSERLNLSADDVIRWMSQIVQADIREAFNEDGSLKKPHELPDSVACAVSSIEYGDSPKIRLNSRDTNLANLAKHYGLLLDRMQAEVTTEANVQIYLPDNGRGEGNPDG